MHTRLAGFPGRCSPWVPDIDLTRFADLENKVTRPVWLPIHLGCFCRRAAGASSPRDPRALIADLYAAYAYLPEFLAEAAGLP